jgi:hypothetical protein
LWPVLSGGNFVAAEGNHLKGSSQIKRATLRREIMRLIGFLQYIWRRVYDRVAFLDYKLKQRRHLKKQKEDDPNIYPMW